MAQSEPLPAEPKPGPAVEPRTDSLYGLTTSLVKAVESALADGNKARVRELIRPLHDSDLADLIGRLTWHQRLRLIDAAGSQFTGEVLAYLDESVREQVMRGLLPGEIAAAISDLDSDDAVSVLQELGEPERQEVLQALTSEDRADIEQSLSYPENSAGRLMQGAVVGLPAYWTAGQAIDHMREASALPDTFFEIYVVDERGGVQGVVSLSRLLRARRTGLLRDLMETDVKVIPATTDQEEVARVFEQYNLVAAPIVAENGRLIGVISADDVVAVIGAEAAEDVLKFSGVSGTDIYRDAIRTSSGRFTWLLVNLFTAILASWVIYQFDASIEQMVGLAVLMPIVASMGGNAGTQIMAVAVRALATRDLSGDNFVRVLLKETVVGAVNGVLFAVIVGAVAGLWYWDLPLGVVIGSAMVINLISAGFFGLAIPFVLWRLKIDPATSAGVFLTTVTDVVGFLAFLGLATMFLV